MKVFLIDDDELQTELLIEIINSEVDGKIKVESSIDTSNITDKIIKYDPDVVILDLYMPSVSGLQVCSDLKDNPLTKNIPVIVLTSSTEHSDKMRCYTAGCIDYLQKPIAGERLIQIIKSYGAIGKMYKSLGCMSKGVCCESTV